MIKILLCLVLIFSLHSYINQNNDIQLWVRELVEVKVAKNVYVDISNQYRIGNHISQLYFIYLEGMLGYQLTNEVLFSSGYRQVWDRSAVTQWRLVYLPFAELILRRGKGAARWELRNRVSYLLREFGEDSWQWRGRLRWVMLEGGIRPYFSNELFIDSIKGFDQDRIIFGTLIPIIERCRGDFYYLLRFLNEVEHVTHQHIFGAEIHLNF